MTVGRIRDKAVEACRKAGVDPFEVIPVGPCLRMSGDRLVEGEEVERWVLELDAEGRRALGLGRV